MRASRPVHFDERMHSWCIFRYDDVKSVMADHASFSSDHGRLNPGSALDKIFRGNMSASDPPRHGRLRGLVSRAFTQRSVVDLEPFIARIAHELLDAIIERGRCELNADFASILPTLVIAELLGVPAEDHGLFRRLMQACTTNFDSAVNKTPLDPRFIDEQFNTYFRGVLSERRARPGPDMITRLIEAEIDGERLDDKDLLSFCRLLLVAGSTTTFHLISNTILTLLEHPDDLARLRADERLLPSAIEEVLRYRPPLNVWFRIAAKDVELRGQRIGRGQEVLLIIGSANRDEAHFPDPDRFDIARTPNNHLAFSSGVHFCLGAPLARLETQVAVKAILQRLPDLEIDSERPLEAHAGPMVNGAVRLPLRFRIQLS
jgi:cytochrome P450